MSLTIKVKFYDIPEPQTYTIPWTPNIHIQQAMEQCFNQYSVPHSQHPFTFWIQYYGTYNTQYLGYMPIEINGRRKSGEYLWFVYVNGAKSNNSLNDVALNPGDIVEFKYESYNASEHTEHPFYTHLSSLNHLFNN